MAEGLDWEHEQARLKVHPQDSQFWRLLQQENNGDSEETQPKAKGKNQLWLA